MSNLTDIIGRKFERLTVIKFDSARKNGHHWLCKCDCGNDTIVSYSKLKSGHTKSCGCLHKDRITRHGEHKTRLYTIWHGMISRCSLVPNSKSKNYGDRGIRVCDEWKVYENFKVWAIENGYKDNLTIERKNVNGNYEPSNCEWIELEKQLRNTRRNKQIVIDGESHLLIEWSEITGVDYQTMKNRYHRGDRGKNLIRPVGTKRVE